MKESLDLGVASLSPLPGISRAPGTWTGLIEKIAGRPFFRSDGLRTVLGPPQRVASPLADRCRDTVAHFNSFYEQVIRTYFEEPNRRAECLINPQFEQAILADKSPISLPLSRLDCVLTESGELKVIEINPVGVCTIHLQSVLYLARELERSGNAEDAALLLRFGAEQVASFRRLYESQCAQPKERPTVGALWLKDMYRPFRALLRATFHRFGWNYVEGLATDVEISPTGMRVRGTPIDALWGDFVFHLGYQYVRYRETKWPSRMGSFDAAPAQMSAIMGNPVALELFRSGKVVNVTPARAYVALSKHLLSWIDREDFPLQKEEREWLRSHVAKTYDVAARARGLLSQREAMQRREELLLKPCQYGGSHGVQVGHSVSSADWEKRLEAIWEDPNYVLQEFHMPCRARDGELLSLGLYNYGGKLGGVTIRTGADLVISARSAPLIAAVPID